MRRGAEAWLGLGSAVPLVNGQAVPVAVTTRTGCDVGSDSSRPAAASSSRHHLAVAESHGPREAERDRGRARHQQESVLAVEIAAIASRGGAWPLDGTRCTATDVLILEREDDPEDRSGRGCALLVPTCRGSRLSAAYAPARASAAS